MRTIAHVDVNVAYMRASGVIFACASAATAAKLFATHLHLLLLVPRIALVTALAPGTASPARPAASNPRTACTVLLSIPPLANVLVALTRGLVWSATTALSEPILVAKVAS
jgi:hypothetical protein